MVFSESAAAPWKEMGEEEEEREEERVIYRETGELESFGRAEEERGEA